MAAGPVGPVVEATPTASITRETAGMTIKMTSRRGFTLVELMIVVAIIGVLAALAIYGVRRYVFTAKTAEATMALGRMGKDIHARFNAESMPGVTLALTSVAEKGNQICTGVANPFIPATSTAIAGKKYQSSPSEWENHGATDTTGWTGFKCVKFSHVDPTYYQYGYETTCAGAVCNAAADTFTGIARGDLDGDATLSTWRTNGGLQAVDGVLTLTIAPNFEEIEGLE